MDQFEELTPISLLAQIEASGYLGHDMQVGFWSDGSYREHLVIIAVEPSRSGEATKQKEFS